MFLSAITMKSVSCLFVSDFKDLFVYRLPLDLVIELVEGGDLLEYILQGKVTST